MSDTPQIARFTDGEGCERFMGRWSRVAGRIFLDWLSLPGKLKWVGVGCGTGAFTEIIKQSSGASEISRSTRRQLRYRMRNRAKVPKGSSFKSPTPARCLSLANVSMLRYRHWCSISSLTVKKLLPKCAVSCEPAGLRRLMCGILPAVAVRSGTCTPQLWELEGPDTALRHSMPKAQRRRISRRFSKQQSNQCGYPFIRNLRNASGLR